MVVSSNAVIRNSDKKKKTYTAISKKVALVIHDA